MALSVAEPGPKALSLGLPLRAPGVAWAAVGTLFGVYALSMARDLSLFDSPELALVAVQLGLGHPPGQPLHTLLGFLIAHIPGLPPLLGLNALSAMAGALCVLPVISVAQTLAPKARSGELVVIAAVAVASGCHAALWEPATRVEVYTLAALPALWSVARVAAAGQDGRPGRDFALAGFALGLCAATNPYVSLIAALAVGPLVLHALVTRRLPLHIVACAVVGGLAGLMPYAYVPLIASRKDVMVWGAPLDVAGMRRFFLGLDYARSRGVSMREWMAHVGDWVVWAIARGIWPLPALGLLGYVCARRYALALVAASSVVLTVLLVASTTVWQPDVPDYLSYLAAPLWLCAAGLCSLPVIVGRVVRGSIAAGFAIAAIASCVSAPPSVFTRTRHLDHVARMLAAGALADAPPRAFLIAEADHWVAPMLYLQQVEGVRPDVVVVAFGLASSSWFWHQTFARHPDVHPIALQDPAGRAGRIKRLLAANSERAIQVENGDLARRLELHTCVRGWLRSVEPECSALDRLDVERSLRRVATKLGEGAPSALAALSGVAYARGLDLWEQGDAVAADAALLSVVSPPLRLQMLHAPASKSSLGAPPQIVWQRDLPLGDPSRNALLASILRARLGDYDGAARLARDASERGLVEAWRLVQPSK